MSPPSPPSILLVDRNPDSLKRFQALLIPEEFIIIQTTKGKKIEQLVAENHFSLVLLDCPGQDYQGVPDIVKTLRNQSDLVEVPILFLLNGQEIDVSLLQSQVKGIVDFLVRPFHSVLLRKKVQLLLELQNMGRKLKEKENLLTLLLDCTDSGIWDWDIKTDKLFLSRPSLEMLGYDEANKIEKYEAWLNLIHPDDRIFFNNLIQDYIKQKTPNCLIEYRGKCKNETYKWIHLKAQCVWNTKGQPTRLFGMQTDITDKKLVEDGVHNFVYHDILTELPNRLLFFDRLKLAIARARKYKTQIGVLLLDMDNFKRINDTLGHDSGDILLQAVAQRIKGFAQEIETVARMGGDEFGFIFPDISQIPKIVLRAKNLLEIFTKPFDLKNQEIFISSSIGISLFPSDGQDMESLVKNADIAMYRAKNQGGNSYQLYAPEMNARAFERLSLENNLRRALENNELSVYYQPRVNTLTRKITGLEALLRWEHSDLGFISPEVFIQMAEETGMINSIGEWILRTACAQLKIWMDTGYAPMCMAVNLSVRQLQIQDFAEIVISVIKETGIDPCMLELEITESLSLKNVEVSLPIFNKLNELGVRIAIDDFGTGYSSLSYLRKYPIQTLKIDQSFVREISFHKEDPTIVQGIITIAKGLKLNTIAEGVENEKQLTLLQKMGCHEMQGYLFSPPLPEHKIAVLLKKGHFEFP